MTVRELASAAGCSDHTIRYYDRLGLLPLVERNRGGHRQFRAEHVGWVKLLRRLRASGMPIATMKKYSALVAAGDGTKQQRRELLCSHRDGLTRQIEELTRSLTIVEAKIDLYDGRITDPQVVWRMVE